MPFLAPFCTITVDRQEQTHTRKRNEIPGSGPQLRRETIRIRLVELSNTVTRRQPVPWIAICFARRCDLGCRSLKSCCLINRNRHTTLNTPSQVPLPGAGRQSGGRRDELDKIMVAMRACILQRSADDAKRWNKCGICGRDERF